MRMNWRFRDLTGIFRGHALKRLGLLLMAGSVAGCSSGFGPNGSDLDVRYPTEETSRAIAQRYSNIQNALIAKGNLRTDGSDPALAFTAEDLSENFVRIAMFNEYKVVRGRFVRSRTRSAIRRWADPVRISIVFGDSVSADQRAADTKLIRDYADRLARVTGHPISMADIQPNFHVLILNRVEQTRSGAKIRQLIPRIPDFVVRELERGPTSIFCNAFSFFKPDRKSEYESALILIKAEHIGLMRESCVHEEMAQALGLINDSASARPSIFNDDEEFALLTLHDELLLKMLYDPRISPGMRDRAIPIVRKIARELRPKNPDGVARSSRTNARTLLGRRQN